MRKRVESDLLTSSKDSFGAISVVGKRYQVTDGLLQRAERGVVRTYNPFREFALPTALARVSTREITPLEFASRFGEMGYSKLVRSTMAPSFSACLPKSPKWKSAHTAYKNYRDALYSAASTLPDGDPLNWLLAHSRTVALCLKFIGLLAEGHEEEIRYEVENVSRGPYGQGVHLVEISPRQWRRSLEGGSSASGIIRLQLCHLITENTAGIRRWMITDPFATRTESFFLANATIEAVYWQLADRMEAKEIRRCLECRRFFVSRDKRQQYCPALPGSTRSRCSSRLNVQNFRDREEGRK